VPSPLKSLPCLIHLIRFNSYRALLEPREMGSLPVLCPETRPPRRGSCLPPASPLLLRALLPWGATRSPPRGCFSQGRSQSPQSHSSLLPLAAPLCFEEVWWSADAVPCPQGVASPLLLIGSLISRWKCRRKDPASAFFNQRVSSMEIKNH